MHIAWIFFLISVVAATNDECELCLENVDAFKQELNDGIAYDGILQLLNILCLTQPDYIQPVCLIHMNYSGPMALRFYKGSPTSTLCSMMGYCKKMKNIN
jgi:hypothetical protein